MSECEGWLAAQPLTLDKQIDNDIDGAYMFFKNDVKSALDGLKQDLKARIEMFDNQNRKAEAYELRACLVFIDKWFEALK